VLHGLVVAANQSGDSVPALAWEAESEGGTQTALTVTVADALAQYGTVDIVHMDFQTAETVCLDAGTMDALTAKVKALHIGTHTVDIHASLRAGFLAAGWSVEHDVLPNGGAPPGRVEETEFGPINFYWDGQLRVINPALVGA
jgi:hypothetical protein